MIPRPMLDNVGNRVAVHPVFTRHRHGAFPVRIPSPDLPDEIVREARISIPRTTVRHPVPDSVDHVLLSCAPEQITDVVVCRIPIEMSRFHSSWARSDECFQDECVNEARVALPVATQSHTQMSVLV